MTLPPAKSCDLWVLEIENEHIYRSDIVALPDEKKRGNIKQRLVPMLGICPVSLSFGDKAGHGLRNECAKKRRESATVGMILVRSPIMSSVTGCTTALEVESGSRATEFDVWPTNGLTE